MPRKPVDEQMYGPRREAPFHETVYAEVQDWLDLNNVDIRVGGTFKWNRNTLKLEEIATALWEEHVVRRHDRPVGEKVYVAALRRLLRDRYTDAVMEAHQKIVLAPVEDDIHLRRALRVMVGDDVDPELFEYYVVAMKQFPWQVKQRLVDRKVRFHTVPIFYSRANGSGKTTFAEEYGRVLGPLCHETVDGHAFSDNFGGKTFSRYYFGLIDEMVGMGGKDEALIKRVISADKITRRMMHSEDSGEYDKNIQFMGTSNKRLTEIIVDPTGMRRWVEIACIEEKIIRSAERLAAFKAIPWAKLWNCVHVDDPSPYGENEALMDKFQSKLVATSDFDAFRSEVLVSVEGARLKNADAHRAYCQFVLQMGGKKPERIEVFGAKMRAHYPVAREQNPLVFANVALPEGEPNR